MGLESPTGQGRLRLALACAVLALFALSGCAVKQSKKPTEAAMSPGPPGPTVPASGTLFTVAASPDANATEGLGGQEAQAAMRPLSLAGFTALAAKADYILIGEGHTSPCDHAVQAELLAALAKAGRSPLLGLEMAAEDRQGALDRFNAGAVAVKDLAKALAWADAWGYPFALYAPIFQVAQDQGLPVYGLNVPPKVVRAFSRKGPEGLTASERRFLPARILLPSEEQKRELAEFFAMHHDMAAPKAAANATQPEPGEPRGKRPARPQHTLDHFLLVQSLWDTKMAERAVAVRRGAPTLSGNVARPVVILAGAGHVENGWGIARRLKILDPQARVLSVTPWRGGEAPEPKTADVFFACPEAHASRMGFTVERQSGPNGPGSEEALLREVIPGSRADKAGLKAGDVILSVGGEKVTSLDVLHTAGVKAVRGGHDLVLEVRRAGAVLTVSIPKAEGPAKTGPEAGKPAPDSK
jgi:uncharacterized iron-regulated protein